MASALYCPHCEDFHIYKGKLACPHSGEAIKGFDPVTINGGGREVNRAVGMIVARDAQRKAGVQL